MEVTVKKVEITLPEVDMALLKELAKKFGWNIGRKKSGIEKCCRLIHGRKNLFYIEQRYWRIS